MATKVKALVNDTYAFCLHGGHVSPEYLDRLLMRECNLKPWELDDPRLTIGRVQTLLAILQGERLAQKEAQARANA